MWSEGVARKGVTRKVMEEQTEGNKGSPMEG